MTISEARQLLGRDGLHLSDEEVRSLICEVERFADFMVEVAIVHQRAKRGRTSQGRFPRTED